MFKAKFTYLLATTVYFVFFIPSLSLHGQSEETKNSSARIEALIDSLWGTPYHEIDERRAFASELYREGKISNSTLALTHAQQGFGECFYAEGHPDSAIFYYKIAVNTAKNLEKKSELGHCLVSLGNIYNSIGDKENSIISFEKGMNVWLEVEDNKMLCRNYMRYGHALVGFDELNDAMKTFVEALSYCEALQDEVNQGNIFSGMSIIHKKQKNMDLALKLSYNALEIFRKADDKFYVIGELNNYGILNKDVGRYEKARKIYQEGMTIASESGLVHLLPSFQVNMAILDNLVGDHKSALAGCLKALENKTLESRPVRQSDVLHELAKAHYHLGNYTVAKDSIKRAISVAHEANSLEKEHQAWKTKSMICKKLGDNLCAIDAMDKYLALNDSIYLLEKTAEIDRLQTVYESKQKEQEIAHLETEAKLDKERKKWLITGIVAIAIAAIGFILSLIIKIKKDRQLHLTQSKLQDSENNRLSERLDYNSRELTSQALHLAQKNELLLSLKEDLKAIKKTGSTADVGQLASKIKFDEQIDNNWEQFTKVFTETNKDFFKNISLKHKGVGKSDLRLAALLSMNLSSKEIANILNISLEGVKKARYRLRKKLALNPDDNLTSYLTSF